MEKITPKILVDNMGFIHRPNLIQDSWEYILDDDNFTCEYTHATTYTYKSISLSECNDKGLGEYYVFIRQGDTNKRHEDEVISITRNMLYVEDLKKLINVLTL